MPLGWRLAVWRAFDDIAVIVGTRRHFLRRLCVREGELSIVLDPVLPTQAPPDPVTDRVLAVVEGARRASRSLCQCCGEPVTPERSPLHQTSSPASPKADASATEAERIQLFKLRDVAEALGAKDDLIDTDAPETEHAAHLRRILAKGEGASWAVLAAPTRERVAALDELDARAPAFEEVTALVRRHLLAGIAMGLPTTLPAMMLVGEPGFGKSWYCKRLATALGLPVRTIAANTTSLGDSITGAYPVWRNARPGIVARTLMAEQVANPLILVDEVDKSSSHHHEDPYRPFYTLLEPENARAMVDDYLGFAIDASHVSWVLAGNSVQHLPDAIRDRLLVLAIPALDDSQRRAVAASVYAEANASRRGYFAPTLADDVVDRLASLTARRMRRALGEAMVRAAADGRRVLHPDDVDEDVHGSRTRRRVGFAPWP